VPMHSLPVLKPLCPSHAKTLQLPKLAAPLQGDSVACQTGLQSKSRGHVLQCLKLFCTGSSHLSGFALTRLENLHHFSNLCDNFRFNVIWHRQSMVVLIFCRRLAGSDVTVMPSVMCTDRLRWWYKHVAHLLSFSTALAFITNMSEKHKSASSSAIQVKNRWKTISIEITCNKPIWKRWTNCWYML
jgi:hypothetical protein